MKKVLKYFSIGCVVAGLWTSFVTTFAFPDLSKSYNYKRNKITPPRVKDTIDDDTTLIFPFDDNKNNPNQQTKSSPLYLRNPSNVQSTVVYDEKTGKFVFYEKIGKYNYRNPHTMSYEDYQKYDMNRTLHKNWAERNALEASANGSNENLVDRYINKNLVVPIKGFDKIFGSNTVTIKPQGAAELSFGLNISKVENPTLAKDLQKTVGFDFNTKIKMGVTGQVGTRLKLGIQYDTEATFEFENQINVAYQGDEDDILQKIEIGNITMPLDGTLITGSHSLFGVKTEMKFGKLTATSIISHQKGETSTIEIKGGATTMPFNVNVNEYEENKHYFLSQYFRDNYDRALKNLPVIRSNINITKVEVWVTNKSGNFENTRNIAAFMDLAETDETHKYNTTNPIFNDNSSIRYPDNRSNGMYAAMTTNYSGVRNINTITSTLSGIPNFVAGRDYDKLQNAKKLSSTEFTFHPNLGYISLNSSLNADEVLAVSYEYTAGGQTYKVGEFSTDPPAAPQAMIMKLLKSTTLSVDLPIWDLMMKNVYSIGAYQVNNQEFKLDVMYRDDKTGTSINYLTGGNVNQKYLIDVLGLDNLNSNNEAGADGVFDFIDNVTIKASNGRIYFPSVEPFGSYLRAKIIAGHETDPEYNRIADQYVFQELYDQTKSKASQLAEKNKFFLSGEYKSAGGSEINLNAMNVPEGSVKVTAGGAPLVENTDYTVDYNLGRVTILNQGLLESGTPIQISMESNSMFAVATKSLLGTHLNYQFSDKFNIGGTIMHLREKPLTNKVSIGNEPIANTIWGLNMNYSTDVPFLTKLVDKIPLIETKEKSSINFIGEFAQFLPGHPKVIGADGFSFIDDFEATKTTIDLKSPYSWVVSGIPMGQKGIFPESDSSSWASGYNRAKIAWYNVNTDFLRSAGSTPGYITADDQSNHLVREIPEKELFPNKDPETAIPNYLSVFNLAYYPAEKGPYNFDLKPSAISAGLDNNGSLLDPKSRWGGIMRSLITNDFEEANIEYIEFWMLDPFVNDSTRNGGDIYFNLGNISEDILKDSRQSFENGLSTTATLENVDTTAWGIVPRLPRITDAFANTPADARQYQDVGLDGLSDANEALFYSRYLSGISALFGQGSQAYQKASEDPSSDNYLFFKDGVYDQSKASILERYKKYNNAEGNSAIATGGAGTAGQQNPDMEDINGDFTLNETENYFQYKVHIEKQQMQVGQNFITDIRKANVTLKNDDQTSVKWYQFKIPITEFQDKVGSIEDFKSIRFMRLFMHNWDEEVVLRFAKLDLVRGEWRKYANSMIEGGEGTTVPQITDAEFDVSAVNIEENADRQPVKYLLPPGVTREVSPQNPQMQELNEQSIVLKVFGLDDGDARAVYKNVGMDVRQYKKLQMYIHAEAVEGNVLNDDDVCAFIRLGSDYKENYYEYEIPLKLTQLYQNYNNDIEADREQVWNPDNMLDLQFEELQGVKQRRNSKIREGSSGLQLTSEYSEYIGNNRISVVGTPNISNIRTIMIGVRNRKKETNKLPDDGFQKTVEIWMNELRLTDFNEQGGWAANARLSAILADFATIGMAGNISTPGFGSIEKKVSERQQSTDFGYDFTSNFELGKFFPQKYGVKIPTYFAYSQNFSNPQYDPTDPDILLKTTLSDPNMTQSEKNEKIRQSQTYMQRKSINVTNVKINGNREKNNDRTSGGGKNEKSKAGNSFGGGGTPFYHISNWSTSYGYNETNQRNPSTEYNVLKQHTASLAYNFNKSPKNITPFQKVKLFNYKAFALIKDINFYLSPNLIAIRTDFAKSFNEVKLRNIDRPLASIDPIFTKSFSWQRVYDVKYSLTKNLKLSYTATNGAWIDESREGRLDKSDRNWQLNRDTLWRSFKNFGRTTHFNQDIEANWAVPINKIPGLGWTNANAQYNASFDWDLGPAPVDTMGNDIKNSQEIRLSLQMNVGQLYTKVKFLKDVDNRIKNKGKKQDKKFKEVVFTKEKIKLYGKKAKSITHSLKTTDVTVKAVDANGKEINGTTEVISPMKIKFTPNDTVSDANITVTGKIEQKPNISSMLVDYTLYALMGVRNIGVTYSETNGTVVPGYKPKTRFLGMDSNWDGPGYKFLLGDQDEFYGRIAGENGWLSGDSLVNAPIMMSRNVMISFTAAIEPLKGLRIDLTADRTVNSQHSEFWSEENGSFVGKNKRYQGGYSITYNTFSTAFRKIGNSNYASTTFNNFMQNRIVIANRIADKREIIFPSYDRNKSNTTAEDPLRGKGFPYGYNSTSQEVLIPAFLAAYSDKNASNVGLSPFPKIPFPNWRVKYEGLSDYDFVKRLFKKVIFNHAFNSKYSVGNYTTETDFLEDNTDGFANAEDALTGMYTPKYEIDGVTLDERFVPLLGADLSWNNNLTSKVEYKQARMIALSFSDNKIMETLTKEYTVGAGFKIPQLEIPLSIGGNQKLYKSDLNLRADFTFRDEMTIIRRILEQDNQLSSGQKNISVKFSTDYILNERFTLRLFYDQIITNPRVSTSYKTSNIKVGFSIRFNLIAQ